MQTPHASPETIARIATHAQSEGIYVSHCADYVLVNITVQGHVALTETVKIKTMQEFRQIRRGH